MRRFTKLSGAGEGYKGDYDGIIHIPENIIIKPINALSWYLYFMENWKLKILKDEEAEFYS